MIIHLLNMLIAIMGNTFAERSDIKVQIRMKNRLRFVITNWYLSDLAFTDKDKLKYIVTAFTATDPGIVGTEFET